MTIPRDHKMGDIESPSIFKLEFSSDPARYVILQSVSTEKDPQIFLKGVEAKVFETANYRRNQSKYQFATRRI